jgi:hypothetical protein
VFPELAGRLFAFDAIAQPAGRCRRVAGTAALDDSAAFAEASLTARRVGLFAVSHWGSVIGAPSRR